MEYICHRHYKKTGASGKDYNIRRGTKLESIGKFIAQKNTAVCSVRSQDAYMYFARNDDGNGIERGELTHAIAYSERTPNEDNGYRFTDEEAEMLSTEYGKYLKENGQIIFNEDFFNAPIEDLREIADRLGLR